MDSEVIVTKKNVLAPETIHWAALSQEWALVVKRLKLALSAIFWTWIVTG